jgi:hypothetical protein
MSQKENPDDEGRTDGENEKKVRDIVGSAFATIIWFFVDLTFVWPESHERAWWLGIVFLPTQLLQISQIPLRTTVITVVIWLAIGGIGYRFIPPTPKPETETHFWVETGNEPTPKDLCAGVSSNELVGEFGNNFATKTKDNYYTAVDMPCTRIILERTPEGTAAISTVIRDEEGKIAARITDNEVRLMPWENDWSERSDDRSSVIVLDSYGKPVFTLRSKNSQIVEFEGIFLLR